MPADVTSFVTAVAQVRALIPDIEKIPNSLRPGSPEEFKFSDEHLQAFLDLSKLTPDQATGNPYRAAALAVSALAHTEAEIGKVIKTEDLQTNGATVMNAMQPRAAWLNSMADLWDENQDGGGFTLVPYYLSPPQWEWR